MLRRIAILDDRLLLEGHRRAIEALVDGDVSATGCLRPLTFVQRAVVSHAFDALVRGLPLLNWRLELGANNHLGFLNWLSHCLVHAFRMHFWLESLRLQGQCRL